MWPKPGSGHRGGAGRPSQGRVNTTGRMIAWGGTPFGALVGGAVAEAAGVCTAYLVLAVPLAIGLGALLDSPVRRLRTAVA